MSNNNEGITMDLNYECNYSPGGDALIVRDASDDVDDDRLSFVARVNDLEDDHEVLLTKQDALDLAWSVLEHYAVATRPVQPIDKGDYIVVQRASSPNCGLLGRVVDVRDTGGHVSLSVTDLAGERRWVSGDDVRRLTPAEFKTFVNTRIDEIMTELF